jgi:2-polyprenyl-3-methyl-5-hydroxy-6-metoxy-1,4-benzoquinol methylase
MSLPTKCPLCGADHTRQDVVTRHVYGGKVGQAFFHCDSCDVNYMHPRLTAEEEAKFYAAEFESFMSGRSGEAGGWEQPEKHIQMNVPNQTRRMKYIQPKLKPGSRVLEIGCSSGFMLYPLLEQGHECTGIEPSGVFGEFVNKKGINCFNSMDELTANDQYKGYFDVVMHFFVLEHISTPGEFLAEQLELIKPGGYLIFEIPNAADPLYSVYDIAEFERFYWSVAHHWYFNEASTKYLLSKTGEEYEIILDQRYDLSNHMVWARDGKPGGMGRYTEMIGEGVEEYYKQALIDSGNCDTLVGIIRKS